jgi:hypothetical protein
LHYLGNVNLSDKYIQLTKFSSARFFVPTQFFILFQWKSKVVGLVLLFLRHFCSFIILLNLFMCIKYITLDVKQPAINQDDEEIETGQRYCILPHSLSLTLRLSYALYSVFRHYHDLSDIFDIQMCRTQNKTSSSIVPIIQIQVWKVSCCLSASPREQTHTHTHTLTPPRSVSLSYLFYFSVFVQFTHVRNIHIYSCSIKYCCE